LNPGFILLLQYPQSYNATGVKISSYIGDAFRIIIATRQKMKYSKSLSSSSLLA